MARVLEVRPDADDGAAEGGGVGETPPDEGELQAATTLGGQRTRRLEVCHVITPVQACLGRGPAVDVGQVQSALEPADQVEREPHAA
jgi:hypothetical protein